MLLEMRPLLRSGEVYAWWAELGKERRKEGRKEGGRESAVEQFGSLAHFRSLISLVSHVSALPSFLPSAFSLPLPVQGAPYGRGKAFGKSLVDVPPAGGPTL